MHYCEHTQQIGGSLILHTFILVYFPPPDRPLMKLLHMIVRSGNQGVRAPFLDFTLFVTLFGG